MLVLSDAGSTPLPTLGRLTEAEMNASRQTSVVAVERRGGRAVHGRADDLRRAGADVEAVERDRDRRQVVLRHRDDPGAGRRR